ncbi:GAS2-like protein pickled eggs [Eumeta japonica]|uniref:GAS2-like protein pickled eggs n=1 Tax=Eumeta variegata TaxID=151549 RepID=A0A4C1U327_EUMVA|nr:GAS2-like protein pickled eggs [Eumeta japonica]
MHLYHLVVFRARDAKLLTSDARMASIGAVMIEARPFRPFKSSEEYLYAMKEDLAEWLALLYPELRINADNFLDRLDTGVVLCRAFYRVNWSARLSHIQCCRSTWFDGPPFDGPSTSTADLTADKPQTGRFRKPGDVYKTAVVLTSREVLGCANVDRSARYACARYGRRAD